MDTLGSDTPHTKRHRRHSTQFREELLNVREEPGRPVAEVAHRCRLNVKLIHKWRRGRKGQISLAPPAFVPLTSLVPQKPPSSEATVVSGQLTI